MIYERAARRAIGRTIESVAAPDPWFLKGGLDAAAVSATLVGARIEGVDRRGKLLMLLTDGPVVGLRFGMTGRLMVDGDEPIDELLYSTTQRRPEYERFTLGWGDGSLVMIDPRRLGGVELDPDLGRLGPDAASVSIDELAAALARTGRPLKAAMLDQSLVAGVGNLICDETLWRVGISPQRPANELERAEVVALARRTRSTVSMLDRRGGSHLGDLQYERHRGGVCPRDGAPLERAEVGGRTTYWCPVHQH